MKSLPLLTKIGMLIPLASLVIACGSSGGSTTVGGGSGGSGSGGGNPTPTPIVTTDPPTVIGLIATSEVQRGQTVVVSAQIIVPAGLPTANPFQAVVTGPLPGLTFPLTLADISCVAGATTCTPIGTIVIPANQPTGIYQITFTVFDQLGRSGIATTNVTVR